MCAVAACGDNAQAPPDAAPDASPFGAPSDRYPAFGVGRPEITSVGGPVMSTVRVVPIFYADEASGTQQLAFLHKLAASATWPRLVSEYGVGALTIDTPITLSSNAPATLLDSDLQAILTSGLDGTHAEYGAVDATTLAHTIFLFHTPLTTAASGPYGGTTPWNCNPVGGYHWSITLPSTAKAIYAISYDCAPPPYLATTLDLTTSIISHELVEAATDPFHDQPAFTSPNIPALPWAVPLGAELGDMCELVTNDWYVPADVGYTVQRAWSNTEALMFHDPCVPVPAGDPPYFAAIPDAPDFVLYSDSGGTFSMPGTRIAVGQSRTIEVDLSSAGPTDDWTVDASEPLRAGQAATLSFALDRDTGRNGNLVHLTITALSRPATGVSFYRVRSILGTTKHVWFGAVGVLEQP